MFKSKFSIIIFGIYCCQAMDYQEKNNEIVTLLCQGNTLRAMDKFDQLRSSQGISIERLADLKKRLNAVDADFPVFKFMWPVTFAAASVIYLWQDYFHSDQPNRLGSVIALGNLANSVEVGKNFLRKREEFLLTRQKMLLDLDRTLGDA